MEISIHYDFKDWKLCRAKWVNLLDLYPFSKMYLVLSKHEYTSGYWIENSDNPNFEPEAFIYPDDASVKAFFDRLERALEQMRINDLPHRLIT